MKNIKRLTNEKALLAKAFREHKEKSGHLKQQLDENINRYQQLQKKYDDLAAEIGEEEEHVRPTPSCFPFYSFFSLIRMMLG